MKKLLLGLGTLSTIALTSISVVSCGTTENKLTLKADSINDFYRSIWYGSVVSKTSGFFKDGKEYNLYGNGLEGALEYAQKGLPADMNFILDANALTDDGQVVEHLKATGDAAIGTTRDTLLNTVDKIGNSYVDKFDINKNYNPKIAKIFDQNIPWDGNYFEGLNGRKASDFHGLGFRKNPAHITWDIYLAYNDGTLMSSTYNLQSGIADNWKVEIEPTTGSWNTATELDLETLAQKSDTEETYNQLYDKIHDIDTRYITLKYKGVQDKISKTDLYKAIDRWNMDMITYPTATDRLRDPSLSVFGYFDTSKLNKNNPIEKVIFNWLTKI